MAYSSETLAPTRAETVHYRARRASALAEAEWTRMAKAPTLPPGVRAAVAELAKGGRVGRADLLDLCEKHDGMMGAPVFEMVLERFAGSGKLDIIETTPDGAPRMTAEAGSAALLQLARAAPAFEAAMGVRLSRYACIRPDNGDWIVEGPFTALVLRLHSPTDAQLISGLSQAVRYGRCAEAMSAAQTALLLPALCEAGLLVAADAAEGADGEMVAWDHHDLMFHTRSRMGRHERPFGGTYRGKGRTPMPRAMPETPPAKSYDIGLFKPDLDALRRCDKPLAEVMEQRSSRRQFGDPVLSCDQLGEFLFRACGTRRITSDASGWEAQWKPYPAGGAIHELEIYLLIKSCGDIAQGLYHYNAVDHRLGLVHAGDAATEHIMQSAYHMMARSDVPHVMIMIAARFDRVFWKYESMAYSLVLKNVGVLLQTMYLSAEAMELAACALGGGNSDLFAKLSGRPYLREGLVGELALGTRPKEATP